MAQRITEAMLQKQVDRLNRLTGSPMAPYEKTPEGMKPCPLSYHLSGAYGGWQLSRMCETGTGVSAPLGLGFVPKRELFENIWSFAAGIEEGQK